MKVFKCLIAMVLVLMFLSPQLLALRDLAVADFEVWQNNLGGNIGVYGSLEPNWDKVNIPYSWLYDSKIKDSQNYKSDNIKNGKASYRLVNATGANPSDKWGSFSIELGPIIDSYADPVAVKSIDVSDYTYLKFWLKGEKGDETITVNLRDSRAKDYMPQYVSKKFSATKKWKKVSLPLKSVKKWVNTKELVNLSVGFGAEQGNERGAIVYIDDVSFSKLP